MKRILSAAVLFLALAGLANAQTGPVSVMSFLSGLDVSNRTGSSCDGFEIDLVGVSPGEVLQTYRNPDFGSPSVSPEGGDTVVIYKGHKTDPGSVEHFGVSISGNSPSATRYRWTASGRDCGTSSDVGLPEQTESVGGDTLSTDLRNDSPDGLPIWIQRRVLNTNRAVTLEELKTDNPAYTDGSEVDSSPEKLEPGETLSQDDSLDSGDKVESVVEAADVYADDKGEAGEPIGTVINASIVNPGGAAACVNNLASLALKPNHGKGGVVHPTGTVRLSSKAPAGGEIVMLSSDTPSEASVPTTVTINAGSKQAKFSVTTHPVSEKDTVDIKATCGSIDKEARLVLTR